MKRTMISIVTMAIVGAIVLYACNKNDSSAEKTVPPGKQQVSLYLADDPGFFDKVNIDIKSVKVLIDTCDKDHHRHDSNNHDTSNHCVIWDSLAIRPGVYDLLTLRNGVDTLFANGVIPDGRIIKIRIDLGTNNSLVKDSVTYPLNLAPGTSTTIILTMRGDEWEEFSPGRFRLWLDFDVERSIIRVRDGMFWLRPVLHFFLVKATGAIEGKAIPHDAFPVISIYNSTDTAYALPFHEGEFKARGLTAGTYTVFVNASNGYQDTTISNVTVKVGKETDIGTIKLHK